MTRVRTADRMSVIIFRAAKDRRTATKAAKVNLRAAPDEVLARHTEMPAGKAARTESMHQLDGGVAGRQ
jgi:hypothetical protein